MKLLAVSIPDIEVGGDECTDGKDGVAIWVDIVYIGVGVVAGEAIDVAGGVFGVPAVMDWVAIAVVGVIESCKWVYVVALVADIDGV